MDSFETDAEGATWVRGYASRDLLGAHRNANIPKITHWSPAQLAGLDVAYVQPELAESYASTMEKLTDAVDKDRTGDNADANARIEMLAQAAEE
jgi:hypothetical protein